MADAAEAKNLAATEMFAPMIYAISPRVSVTGSTTRQASMMVIRVPLVIIAREEPATQEPHHWCVTTRTLVPTTHV